MTLTDLMPELKKQFHNFYDINLQVYRSAKDITVIDIRYYPKTSLDEQYQLKVAKSPPMLHCKVSFPPWLSDKKEKFDINWEHNEGWNKLRLMWLKLKLKFTIKSN